MGKLIDADRLKEIFRRNVVGGNAYFDLIDSAPTVEAIPKAEYEARLKADLKAILVELQLQMEEYEPKWVENDEQAVASCRTWEDLDEIIQQKINELNGVENGKVD